MHTRGSHKLSPLAFDPEIERTLRRNRVLLRENKVIGSPTTPITPKNTMDPPPPTMGQTAPSTPPPNSTTNPTPIHEIKPTNTTLPTSTQTDHSFSHNPSSTVPPFNQFFPTAGQSSSQHSQPLSFQQNPPIVQTTPSFQQPQPQSRMQYQQPIGT